MLTCVNFFRVWHLYSCNEAGSCRKGPGIDCPSSCSSTTLFILKSMGRACAHATWVPKKAHAAIDAGIRRKLQAVPSGTTERFADIRAL